MKIETVSGEFSVCKTAEVCVPGECDFCFTARTDREFSLVCPSDRAPSDALSCDGGWRMFRVSGTLDFSLVGILADITGVLAENGIPVFAVSTFDTDYVLTKKESFEAALSALGKAGWTICEG